MGEEARVVLVCVADILGVAIWKVCGMRRACQGASGGRRKSKVGLSEERLEHKINGRANNFGASRRTFRGSYEPLRLLDIMRLIL